MKKTPNVQRRTSNVELVAWKPTLQERANGEYGTKSGRRYDLEERLLDFAATIVRLIESLPSTRAGNHIASQLLRCGTSPLSNHGEVEAAESRKDFVHKLGICLKELRETKRWLRLIVRLNLIEAPGLRDSLIEVDELIRIFVASVQTARNNSK